MPKLAEPMMSGVHANQGDADGERVMGAGSDQATAFQNLPKEASAR